jgi:hypothetical protein
MKKKVFLLAPAAAALVFAFAGCSKEAPKNLKAPQPAGRPGRTGPVGQDGEGGGRSVSRSVEATGTLAPWDEVIVSNDTPGTVER